uniref:Uncharacterized protein n=1 Tax=Anguilla anguilla TaxID=7936 RepID=A0A0E9UMN1_ANGAN
MANRGLLRLNPGQCLNEKENVELVVM